MKFAYADPPYPGQARRHYGADPSGIVAAEVDHAELIRRLCRDYDGWALSTGSVNLLDLMRLADADGYVMPEGVHVGAWVKPFASFKPGVNPAYAWEPVIFYGGRPRGKEVDTLHDWVSANITMQRGTHGAKPDAFCWWMFEMLGLRADDTFDDLYPGSGAVMRAYASWRRQTSLYGREQGQSNQPALEARG